MFFERVFSFEGGRALGAREDVFSVNLKDGIISKTKILQGFYVFIFSTVSLKQAIELYLVKARHDSEIYTIVSLLLSYLHFSRSM